MASLYPDAMADFVEATLHKYIRGKWADITRPFQQYFASRLLGKKTQEQEGDLVQWKLRVANQKNAKFTGLFAVDTSNRVNVLSHANQVWSMLTANYIYDLKEPAFQGGNLTKVIDYLKVCEQGLMNDYYDLIENAIWTAPNSVNQNPRPYCGFPFWIQPYGPTARSTVATTLSTITAGSSYGANAGFYGGDPTGFPSGAGGIQTATYPTWNNYVASYAAISQEDFVDKMCNAMDFCNFVAPTSFPELGGGPPMWGLYTTHAVVQVIRRILQTSNDELGYDVGMYKGQKDPICRSIPLQWVPALSTSTLEDGSPNPAYDSQNPVYGVDWSTFDFYYLKGWRELKTPPFRVANQHTVYMRTMDATGQLTCVNRRRNFQIFQVTT